MTYNYVKRLLITIVILVVPLLSTQINSAIAISWDLYYSADTLPDEDPSYPWTLFENFDNDVGVATVSGGVLKLDTTSEQHHWRYSYYWNPDNSIGWTFEVRLKTEADYWQELASDIELYDGTYTPMIRFFRDRTQFIISDGPIPERYVDNAHFRTYRICLKGASLKVYLEGFLFFEGVVTSSLTSAKYTEFGDFHDDSGAISHWDYIAWKYEYCPPSAVGGIWVPVDKLGLLAPYIGLTSTILVATVTTAIYVKRVKRRKEKQ